MVSSGICGALLCCAVYLGCALFARGSDFLFCSRRVSWRSASSSSSFSCASALFVPRSSTLSLMARRAFSASLGGFAVSFWRRAARNRIVPWGGMGEILGCQVLVRHPHRALIHCLPTFRRDSG